MTSSKTTGQEDRPLADAARIARAEAERLWKAYDRIPAASKDKQIVHQNATRVARFATKLEKQLAKVVAANR